MSTEVPRVTSPATISEILTREDLAALTGYTKPAYQARWLQRHGWTYADSRDGPKVLRAYRDQRMGMAATTTSGGTWKPDFSVLG